MAEDIDGGTPAPGVARRYERIADLYEVSSLLLDGLDELGLHQASAHVSLAQRLIAKQHPELSAADTIIDRQRSRSS